MRIFQASKLKSGEHRMPSRITRRLWWTVLVVAMLGGGVFAYHDIYLHGFGVPKELQGVWKTDNPAYADRYFELEPDIIVIGLGGDDLSVQLISSVDAETQGNRVMYIAHAVTYEPSFRPEDKHEVRWFFDYDPAGGGTIRLKGQPSIVWRKVSGIRGLSW